MGGFLSQYGGQIFELTLEHLWLTGMAMLFAAAISVPVGIWLTRSDRWAPPVMAVANILQTIPSLALFGLLLPLPWLGERAARIHEKPAAALDEAERQGARVRCVVAAGNPEGAATNDELVQAGQDGL